jgi:hypothetical protein
MSHAQAIYQAIPIHVKRQFENGVAILVNNLIENVESNPFGLSDQDKDFLTALGQAHGAGDHGAVYEAFGRVLIDE